MGHAGERSRGDSRLRDWPDVECRLVRDKSNDEDGDTDPAARYLAAYGRDVDQPEQLLGYDGTTRRLTIAGGSRKDTKVRHSSPRLSSTSRADPDAHRTRSRKRRPPSPHRKAIALAVERGRVHREEVGNRWVHTLTSPTRPDSPGRTGEPSGDLAHWPCTGRRRDDVNGAPSPNTQRGEVQAEERAALDRGC